MMKVAVRVDVEGAVEIARAARSFDWMWAAGDGARFAAAVGWSAPERIETTDEHALFSRTAMRVWDPSAIFWHGENGLWQVHVNVSDSPDHFAPVHAELLAAAADSVRAAITEVWGAPTLAMIGADRGVAWEFDGLAIGITTARKTVELMVVSSRWQQFWDERHNRRVARRSGMSEWDRYAESLAHYLEDVYSDTILIIDAPGGMYAQFAKNDDLLYAELSQSAHADEDWRYGPEVDLILAADGWKPPDGNSANWHRSYAAPVRTADYSHLAWRVVAGLSAMGVASPGELEPHGWRQGGRDLDTTALAPADDSPWVVVRSGGSHEVFEELAPAQSSDDMELDLPGTLGLIRAASTFDWTWTRADVERFADHAGWGSRTDLKLNRMIYAGTNLELSFPQAIFWLDGEALERVQVTISADMSDYDLEDPGYAYLKDELVHTMRAALHGLRDALGEPVHGSLQYGKSLCWEFPGVHVGVQNDQHCIILELVNPARREESRQIRLRHAVEDIQRTAWNQVTEDLGALVATLAAGSDLVVKGADHLSARFRALSDALMLELDDPDGATSQFSEGTRKHMINYQGWTPPTETRPRWLQRLSFPAMSRDYEHLAHCVIWSLRTQTTKDPKDLVLRSEGQGEVDTGAWPWS
ncbi:DUF6301 family protein [Nocardia aurantiaca]|uniref:TY-Chap N-terminal domain-containing protein n=1 Tax=Nocardia aurantiaca TaxID=2675850 RepID=A0A6I3L848_9NOCA|nr:DUF6301 family protein [Nocardia aurantiaca]MTE17220.1 hypothetical protein [Nocardia aurantiaca]